MKYRKKPVVIEAVRFYPSMMITDELPDGVEVDRDTGRAFIQTLEGELTVNPGDWVITGIKGEKYPCRPDIFIDTYEKVEP